MLGRKKFASNENPTHTKKRAKAYKYLDKGSKLASGQVDKSSSSDNQMERKNLEDSHSKPSPKLQILNNKTDCITFLNICDAFEKVLDEFDLVEDNSLYEKLVSVNKLIEKKILWIKNRKSKNGSLSSLVSTAQSLHLSDNDLDQAKFWKTIICPFCLEFQDDKNNLVNHIDIECSLGLLKKMSQQIPFAEFQILPNDTFKCSICCNVVLENLQHYFTHKHSSTHVQALYAAAKKKYYSECLFCSCCKILVCNSYTQLKIHVNHEVHHKRSSEVKSSQYYRNQGIHCLFGKNKKFKCLDCPSAECQTAIDLLNHFETPSHVKRTKNHVSYNSFLFCAVCNLKVHMFEITSHFTDSETHKENELKKEHKPFELCSYCGCVCDSLMDLFKHMKSDCKEIKKIRIKQKTSQKSKTDEGTETNNDEGKEKNTLLESYITVEDYTNLEELFCYFKKFGEIILMESHNDKDVVIKFREKEVVSDILMLEKSIKIGDKKLKIVVGNPNKHDKTQMESLYVKDGEEKEDKEVEELPFPIEKKKDNISNINSLDVLFERVSIHLRNNIKMSDSSDEKKIIIDCHHTLDTEICELVGFSGCELSFPFESVTLFCSLKKFFNYSNILNEKLLFDNYQKLRSSQIWTDVELFPEEGPYLYIKCVHKETQRTCTITFTRSMKILTSMLRDCMEKSDLAQHFCLIIRFWLSVHELKIAECEYVVIALLVFFFINTEILELSSMFKDQELLTDKFADYKIPSRPNKSEISSVKNLFQKFLQFLSTFDFEKHAICLPTSQPISKTIFTSAEFKRMSGIQNPANLLSCSMCIVDPISFRNLAADIKQKHLKAFLDIVDSTISHYNI